MRKQAPRIVFYAPPKFHAAHLVPVLNKIAESSEWEVILVGEFDNFWGFDAYSRLRFIPLFKSYDLFISTELLIPWWIRCKCIYFGHGVGPKLKYQSSPKIKKFDASFAPCEPIYIAHKYIINDVYKVGLPLLDNSARTSLFVGDMVSYFGLDPKYKIIVYVPSYVSS
jgi:hypothetical protein